MPLDLPQLEDKYAVAKMFFFLKQNFVLPKTKTPQEDCGFAFETGRPYLHKYVFKAKNGLQIRRSYEEIGFISDIYNDLATRHWLRKEWLDESWDVYICEHHLLSFNSDWVSDNDEDEYDYNRALRWTDGKTTQEFQPFILDAAAELALLFKERMADQLAARKKEEENALNKQQELDKILVQMWKEKQRT